MNRRPQGIKEIREARERSAAERRRQLELYKGHQAASDQERHVREAALAAKRSRFTALNVADALAAARRLTFVDLEAEGERVALPLNRPTLALLELYLRALRERASVAALQWPRGSRDVSILHPLAMLAIISSSSERTSAGFKWCPAVADCRTLYYPWRGSGNGTTQRRILVDRGARQRQGPRGRPPHSGSPGPENVPRLSSKRCPSAAFSALARTSLGGRSKSRAVSCCRESFPGCAMEND
jgi:hypothetical protein